MGRNNLSYLVWALQARVNWRVFNEEPYLYHIEGLNDAFRLYGWFIPKLKQWRKYLLTDNE